MSAGAHGLPNLHWVYLTRKALFQGSFLSGVVRDGNESVLSLS